MNASRFVKATAGGAFLVVCFALLAASPMHTAPPELSAARSTSPLHDSFSSATTSENQTHDPAWTAAAGPPPKPPSVEEQFFFQSANRERAHHGLPQLKWDEALAAAARKHAALMADQEELSHRLPGEAELSQRTVEAGARFSTVGENVAVGPESADIHYGWMRSPGHRANILGADYNALGVGVAERDGQLYAVEDFSHAVENLNIEQQEKKVGAMLKERGYHLTGSREDAAEARRICESGFSRGGSATLPYHNMQILQYETPDLGNLPAQLDRSLHNNTYRDAAVGACTPESRDGGMPRFHVVILLFSQA